MRTLFIVALMLTVTTASASLQTERKQVRPNQPSEIHLTLSADARAARSTLVELQQVAGQTYGRLIETMSKDGRKRLRDHVEYLKRRTKVVAKDLPPRPTK